MRSGPFIVPSTRWVASVLPHGLTVMLLWQYALNIESASAVLHAADNFSVDERMDRDRCHREGGGDGDPRF
ncbi:MAG: hypothetical protein WBD13_19745 [Burkholderiaceae bacterium]